MDNENVEELDLLDLDDELEIDELAEQSPFANPRPKRPWLLLGVGLVIIALATYIIIRVAGSDSESVMEINLDTPTVVATDLTPDSVLPPAVHQIEDRKEIVFDPNKKEVAEPVRVQAEQPAAKPAPVADVPARPAAPKVAKPVAGKWYVQFGSYGTRAQAESAQKNISAKHSGLVGGKSFVILAAEVNGKTMYRLRVAFDTQSAANGFCNNAKSDGLDCYVAR